MLVLNALAWLHWGNLAAIIPWPVLCLLTVGIVIVCCVPLTELLARTPLAVPLTGRRRVRRPSRREQFPGRHRKPPSRYEQSLNRYRQSPSRPEQPALERAAAA